MDRYDKDSSDNDSNSQFCHTVDWCFGISANLIKVNRKLTQYILLKTTKVGGVSLIAVGTRQASSRVSGAGFEFQANSNHVPDVWELRSISWWAYRNAKAMHIHRSYQTTALFLVHVFLDSELTKSFQLWTFNWAVLMNCWLDSIVSRIGLFSILVGLRLKETSVAIYSFRLREQHVKVTRSIGLHFPLSYSFQPHPSATPAADVRSIETRNDPSKQVHQFL